MSAFQMCNVLIRSHLYTTIHGLAEDAVDITFSQMVLLQKLTTIAWNVHDGRRKVQVGAPAYGSRAISDDRQDLDEAQLSTRLQHVPTPVAFLGYW